MEHRVINGGRGLAHAASNLLHGSAVVVGGGGLIALGCGAGAGGPVIGELLAGQEDHVVTGLGGQLHIALPGPAAAHAAGGLPQNVPEEAAPQVVLGHLGLGDGQGDGEGLAALGVPVGGSQGLHVKVDAHHVVGNLHSLQVQGGILGLCEHLPVDGLEVGLLQLALGGLEGELILRRLALGCKAVFKRLLDALPGILSHRLPVHCGNRRSLGHHQPVLLQLVAVVLHRRVDGPLHPVHQVVQGELLFRQRQGHLAGAAQHMAHQLRPAGEKAAVADVPGVLGALSRVHRRLVEGYGLLDILIDQGKGDIPALLLHGGLDGAFGLLHRHVGYVDSRY